MKSVAVFFGGRSVEHDVSIITGVLTLNSIDKQKYNVLPVYVDKDGKWLTGDVLKDIDGYKELNYKKLKRVVLLGGENVLYAVKGKRLVKLAEISCAINCMHGGDGENGALIGVLRLSGVACASPDILTSSVCMDKRFTKTVMKGLKVKALPYKILTAVEQIKEFKPTDYPLFVKPNLGGSSVGATRVEREDELGRAVSYALSFGAEVIVEPALSDFIEINCAGYRLSDGSVKVSECERPIGRTDTLSFSDKYEGGKRIFPADIDKAQADKIKSITKRVYEKLGCSGVIRIDFFIKDDEIFLNEVNTVPGSLAYYLFGDTLKSFSGMIDQLIATAELKFNKERSIKSEFKSGILAFSGCKGAKRL